MISENIQTLDRVRELVDEGYSIGMSLKMICGKDIKLIKSVMNSNEYCDLLNIYMNKIGKHMKYKLKNGKLVRETFSKKD